MDTREYCTKEGAAGQAASGNRPETPGVRFNSAPAVTERKQQPESSPARRTKLEARERREVSMKITDAMVETRVREVLSAALKRGGA